ncbi:MAG: hypothetical protein IKP19_01195 [Oscillospiraceae bacterium]|nr:hypothetical protein [Oscillospiraceae bacterium]
MKVGKIIGRVALGALALSVVPYQVKKDEETGSIVVRSLLWALKKTPRGEGEDKDHYAFAIPPSGIDYHAPVEAEESVEEPAPEEPAESPVEEPAEAPAEAPAAE